MASISLTLAWLALLTATVQQSGDLSQGLFQFLGTVDVPVVLASLAACSLALSPGPLRGLAIVGWRRACLMIAGLSAGFGFPSIVQLVYPATPSGDLAFRLLGVLAIALAVAVTRVRSPAGRRVAGLVATGLLPSLAVTLPYPLYGGLAAWLVILVVAVLVWPVAIVSWRGRVRRASRGLGPGQPCPASAATTSRAIAWGICGRVGWPRLTCARTRNMAVFAQVKTRREYLSGCGVVASRYDDGVVLVGRRR